MKLHDYQRTAVSHLLRNPRAGLFLEMGLGKSAVVLSALRDDHLPVLVVAPKRVAENVWQAERDLWRPDLSIAVAAGTPKQRGEALSASPDITVIGRDNIADVPLKHKYKTVVLDEISSFKNRKSARSLLARRLTKTATYIWGLTGTPTPNGYLDLWHPLFLLDRGERLENGIGKYKSRYFKPDKMVWNAGLRRKVISSWKLKAGAEEKIQSLISDICLSMTADDYLDLPDVVFNDVVVPLPAKVTKVYDEIAETLVAELEAGVVTAANAAVLSSKLSQIAAGFIYDTDTGETHQLHSEKTAAVQEIVDGTGSPVLVFYRFKAELDRLLSIEGSVDAKSPGALDAWNRGTVPVLLAHPASMAHGLNLQHGGHTIVWTSLTWEPEAYQQANARLQRQGQAHPVIIHRLVSCSVDTAIIDRLAGKKSVQDALLSALKAGNN